MARRASAIVFPDGPPPPSWRMKRAGVKVFLYEKGYLPQDYAVDSNLLDGCQPRYPQLQHQYELNAVLYAALTANWRPPSPRS